MRSWACASAGGAAGLADLPIAIDDVRAAAKRLEGVAHRTALVGSRTLDTRAGVPVVLKPESLQRAGAFKFRGATNAVAVLRPAAVCTVCVCTVWAPALAVPADSRPTAAEAATARNVSIDSLNMTLPLDTMRYSTPAATTRAGTANKSARK